MNLKMKAENLTMPEAFEYYLNIYRKDLTGKLSIEKQNERYDARKSFEYAIRRRKKETG